jgi:endonuclease YncB( thermonuclease family)
MAKNRPSWWLRHKVLTTLGALILLGVMFGGEDTEPSAATAKPAKPMPTASATPTATATPAKAPVEKVEDEEAEANGQAETTGRPAESEVAEEYSPTPEPRQRRARTYLVTRVIDGDTVELGNGDGVRIVGIDTPERGECGYDAATAHMERLVLGKRVRLTISDEDTDRYGRLLRYVDVGKRDAGLAQIRAGLAIARYDSRDGYGYHERENRYIAVDKATASRTTCPKPKPKPKPVPVAPAPVESTHYANCTAAREAGAAPVRRGDPGYGSHLDRDGDGIGCE